MKLKDLLIGLVLFEIVVHCYYLKNILTYVWNSLSNFDFYSFFELFSISSQLIGLFFLVFGVIGVIRYFTTKNIYNRALKIYLIHHTASILIYLPQRIAFMVLNMEGTETPWFRHLVFLAAIITVVVAIMVYSKQPIRVLPRPISRNTVRLLHFFIDQIYIYITTLGAASLFLRGGGIFDINEMTSLMIGYAILILMPLLYYFVCEAGFKQTLGKVATGAYVRSNTGQNPGIGNLLGRTLCRLIPFEAFSFLTDPMAKWHDQFSGTDVFYKSSVDFNNEDQILDHLVTNEELGN